MRTTGKWASGLRQASSTNPRVVVLSADKGRADIWLKRLADFSQPAILALGIFGYFYTVLPVFQNQQLQEQAARLELEKGEAQRDLEGLRKQQSSVEREISFLQANLAREKARSAKLSTDVTRALSDEIVARRRSLEAERQLSSNAASLDRARWELVMLDFSVSRAFLGYNRIVDEFKEPRTKEPGAFILDADQNWPQPYDDLMSTVEAASHRATNRGDMPSSYYSELSALIAERRNKLNCEKPDFALMRSQYSSALALLEPVVDDELEKYVTSVRDEYAAKKQRVQITEDFRSTSRRMIRVGKVLELDQNYRDRIVALRRDCDRLADKVVEEIRELKGVAH
jgi:hypothetical protein